MLFFSRKTVLVFNIPNSSNQKPEDLEYSRDNREFNGGSTGWTFRLPHAVTTDHRSDSREYENVARGGEFFPKKSPFPTSQSPARSFCDCSSVARLYVFLYFYRTDSVPALDPLRLRQAVLDGEIAQSRTSE